MISRSVRLARVRTKNDSLENRLKNFPELRFLMDFDKTSLGGFQRPSVSIQSRAINTVARLLAQVAMLMAYSNMTLAVEWDVKPQINIVFFNLH